MPKIKPIPIVIVIVIVVAIASAFVWLASRSAPGFKIEKALNDFQKLYSFTQDTDLDGLSDAKEIIYSTDPKNTDSDSDGTPDGEEVALGFDPAQSGQIPLSQRDKKNLTIEYFSWAQEIKKIPDPQLEQELIQEFFQNQNLLDFKLPKIPEEQINLAPESRENLGRYLVETSRGVLPQVDVSYQELAAKILAGQSVPELGKIISGIEEAQKKFQQTPTPPQALKLQKTYLGLLEPLKQLFLDLPKAQRDPVLLSLNQLKGQWLSQVVDEINQQRILLTQTLQQTQ
jgi:hypothetical protein